MHTSLHRDGPTWADKGAPAHPHRTMRANGAHPVGAFTKGTRARWGEDANHLVPRASVALDARLPVVAASHPYADLPDDRARRRLGGGRFSVPNVKATERPTRRDTGPCGTCHLSPCECGKW